MINEDKMTQEGDKIQTSEIISLEMHYSRKKLIVGMENGDINIWKLSPMQIETELRFHKKKVTALTQFGDRYLISGAYFDDKIAIWDL